MNNRLFWGLIAVLILITGIATGASAAGTSERVGFTAADKEFHLTDELFFYYRPGLVVEIVDYSIPTDLQPEVTFTMKDPGGLPLDKDGIFTPGDVSSRFQLVYIPQGEEQKVNYITGSRGPTSDSGGTFTQLEPGKYLYKFENAIPADYDVDATHTLSIAARRDLRDFDLDRYSSNDVVNFVPSGASEPMPRDVVKTVTCNRCHDPLARHGGRYQEVEVCAACHNPALVDDEGISYSLDVMIHRAHAEAGEYPATLNDCSVCHTGGMPTADTLMVANPNPAKTCGNGLSMTELFWGDAGNVEVHLDSASGPLFSMSDAAGSAATGEWVTDGQVFVLVDSDTGEVLQEVTVDNTVFGCANNPPGTFRGEAGMQWDRWASRPSRATCGACHSNIDFENGVGHPAQSNDENCSTCHRADSGNEYDRSVVGAHTVTYKSNQLPGIYIDVISVDNTAPGSRPLVTFSISDKFGPLDPTTLGRLRFSLSGPNEDFDFYVQEDAMGKLRQAGSNYTYQFSARIPMDATGSFSFGAEGRKPITVNPGESNEFSHNDQMQNFTYAFAVTDDAAVDRDWIVDDAKCENCHSNLSLHGSNRHDANGYCQTCHMPGATDGRVRLEGDEEGIHFKYMIHKLHMGAELENGYIVYGYRSSVHDYSHVEFPGDLRNCESCHVDDSYNLPLPAGRLPTVSPTTPITLMEPQTAACLSCHDSYNAAAHADANTGANLGESCSVCHGEGKTYSATRVHAR